MPYAHQGFADVLMASRHLGTEADECMSPSVNIILAETEKSTILRVMFADPVKWVGHPNHVTLTLPNGTSLEGSIMDLDRLEDGRGWVTFGLK